jgi:AcrR family transcriptional regulator
MNCTSSRTASARQRAGSGLGPLTREGAGGPGACWSCGVVVTVLLGSGREAYGRGGRAGARVGPAVRREHVRNRAVRQVGRHTGGVAPDPRITRTRERVLGAAWELLNEVGFDGVTVELVSERSGVARSTLYRHWRSMPEVLRDAFAAQATAARNPVTATTRSAPDGVRAGRRRRARAQLGSRGDEPGRERRRRPAAAARPARLRRRHAAGPARDRAQGQGHRRARRVRRRRGGRRPAPRPGVAPQFYRYQFTDHPVTQEQAAALARAAWAAVRPRAARVRPCVATPTPVRCRPAAWAADETARAAGRVAVLNACAPTGSDGAGRWTSASGSSCAPTSWRRSTTWPTRTARSR